MKKVTLEEAIKNVKTGRWIGHYEPTRGIVEINYPDGLPVLSVGQNTNLYFVVKKDDLHLIPPDVKLEKRENNDIKFVWINTNDDMTFLSICNFRRYGWLSASGKNANHGYSVGSVFANGDCVFPNSSRMNTEMFLRSQLSFLIGFLMAKNSEVIDVLGSKIFSEACEKMIQDAVSHDQKISENGGIVDEKTRIKFITNKI